GRKHDFVSQALFSIHKQPFAAQITAVPPRKVHRALRQVKADQTQFVVRPAAYEVLAQQIGERAMPDGKRKGRLKRNGSVIALELDIQKRKVFQQVINIRRQGICGLVVLQGLRVRAGIVQNQAEIEMRTRVFVVEAEGMAVTCSGRLIVVLQQPKVAASRMRI